MELNLSKSIFQAKHKCKTAWLTQVFQRYYYKNNSVKNIHVFAKNRQCYKCVWEELKNSLFKENAFPIHPRSLKTRLPTTKRSRNHFAYRQISCAWTQTWCARNGSSPPPGFQTPVCFVDLICLPSLWCNTCTPEGRFLSVPLQWGTQRQHAMVRTRGRFQRCCLSKISFYSPDICPIYFCSHKVGERWCGRVTYLWEVTIQSDWGWPWYLVKWHCKP